MKKSLTFNDGTEVPRGWCVTPDHYLTTFSLQIVGPRVNERIQSKYKIVKEEGNQITIQSMSPQIVNEVLALVSQRDAKAISQTTIVIRR